MTHILKTVRRRDHGRSRRYKRHLRQYYSFPKEEVADKPIGYITLGDQDDTVTSMHDDTHNTWHRVLDALGALLMFLHLTRQHDDAHTQPTKS